MEDYLFYCKTIQAHIIKSLFESIKDVFTTVELRFTKNSIQFVELDRSKSCLCHVNLVNSEHEDGFQEFYCAHDFTAGINIHNLYLFLKTVSNDDILTLCIYKKSDTKIHLILENKVKSTKDISVLNILDIDTNTTIVPNFEFDTLIRMSSTKFQKCCKDLKHINEKHIRIRKSGDKFILHATAGMGEKQIIFKHCMENGFEIINKNDNNFDETYMINYLIHMVKSSSLCSNVEIYLHDQNPLVLLYSVGNLGTIKYLLNCVVTEE